jgi:hypothetical protein
MTNKYHVGNSKSHLLGTIGTILQSIYDVAKLEIVCKKKKPNLGYSPAKKVI